MIVADSSALIAIITREPERDAFLACMKDCLPVLISAATVVETRIVARSKGGAPLVALLNEMLRTPGINIVPVDLVQADIADAAHIRFGKGSRHPAGLNFGDLFAYALARSRDLPLLYKGSDFAHTDIGHAVDRG